MTQEEELQLLAMLGLCPADFQRVTRMPTYERGLEELDALKDRARRAFRKASLQLHPDQNGGDAEKTAQFMKLNEFVQKLYNLKLRPPAAPPIIQGFSTSIGTGATNTTTVNVM